MAVGVFFHPCNIEIDDFYSTFLGVVENVVGLQVPVANANAVHVVYSFENLG